MKGLTASEISTLDAIHRIVAEGQRVSVRRLARAADVAEPTMKRRVDNMRRKALRIPRCLQCGAVASFVYRCLGCQTIGCGACAKCRCEEGT